MKTRSFQKSIVFQRPASIEIPMIRLTAILALLALVGCHSSRPIEKPTSHEKLKSELEQIARSVEAKVYARPMKWKLNSRQLYPDSGTMDSVWSSSDERVLVHVAVKDNKRSALEALRGGTSISSGKQPGKMRNLGENAYSVGGDGRMLRIQTANIYIAINAATEERARQFAEDVLASLSSR